MTLALSTIFGFAVAVVIFVAAAGIFIFFYSLKFDKKNFQMQSLRWKMLWGFGAFAIAASALAVFAAIGYALLG